MALPLLLSLIAEPLTGLIDTAFISRLGATQLAAVGVGTTALTSIFWAFNFLGVGTQTETAKAFGAKESVRVRQISSLAVALSLTIGFCLVILVFPFSSRIMSLMGASEEIHTLSVTYFKIRAVGAPAILITFAAFGVLRGLQDMKTPFIIAVSINVMNIVLDALLIFGAGPVPGFGVAGAAWASTISQWAGALWAVLRVHSNVRMTVDIHMADAAKLLRIGGDLFVRTGMLTLFLLLTTRKATMIGPEAGAAHQALRQFWVFTALFLDACAIAGQSLIGFFVGTGWVDQVRRVARVVCGWSLGIGMSLSIIMIAGQRGVEALLVPPSAREVFGSAWLVMCIFQPLNALAFGTDGIHWGTGDFRFLRNVVLLASLTSIGALALQGRFLPDTLTWIWIITGWWMSVRALFGILRIWPGLGNSPFPSSQ
ncbi:MAG: MATE family efflux transporter [Desulfobacteraceae bacterium]|nr:MAG: MATE family efflux transporter [Desulfobacteraceae bacterium]